MSKPGGRAKGPAQPTEPQVDALRQAALAALTSGDLAATARSARQVLDLLPGDHRALHLLGLVDFLSGNPAGAEAWLRRAIEGCHDVAAYHDHLGTALTAQGRWRDATLAYRQAVHLSPSSADIHYNLGSALLNVGEPQGAASALETSVALGGSAAVHANLGTAYLLLRRVDHAILAISRAVEMQPDSLPFRFNLANALREASRHSEAVHQYDEALARSPIRGVRPPHAAPGQRLPDPGAIRELADVHYNRALALFFSGRIAEAWEGYEWRWHKSGKVPTRRPFAQPWWNGEDLSDQGILVWGEQGVGDEIELAILVPELTTRFRQVVLECDPRLVTLFARSFAGVHVVPREALPPPELGAHDLQWQAPLGRVAKLLRPTLEAFAGHRTLLHADERQVIAWRQRLSTLGDAPRVGVAWRSKDMSEDRLPYYSSLEQWQQVFAVPGIVFVNLQYDECSAELAQAETRFGTRIHAFPDLDLMNDLDGAAALTAALDLIITPPTTVAVMAGVLGRPTWQLTKKNGCWETLGTDALPFLSSIRIFNRDWNEGWEAVLARVAQALRSWRPDRAKP